jgi:hypothetical protein
MFANLRARLREVSAADRKAAQRAAPRIQEEAVKASITKRGNTPQYPPLGPKIDTTATAVGSQVQVRAAGWVLRKLRNLGQSIVWGNIVREEGRRALRGGR